MRFIIFARKYRPQTFSAIRGQSHVTTTLRNALKNKKLPQVLAFRGPKGTGKTSCARVLARAINCLALEATGEPCNSCTSCHDFQKDTSFNIHEIDAASNNSVEDIRNLIEQVRYYTSGGKRVFIMDEVHMLSNAAANCLLKIFEEPPSHVFFILATTEKHKIISTLSSRTQPHDFHPIPTTLIVEELRYIAREENITCEEEALQLISHQAQGCMRDAIHMLEKVVNFEGEAKLTRESVQHHLHLLDYIYYFSIIEALYEGQVGNALTLYHQAVRGGFDPQYFITGLSEYCRNLLVVQLDPTLPLLNPISNSKVYVDQSSKISVSFLCHALDLSHTYGLHYKNSANKHLHVEHMLLKIARISANITQIEAKRHPVQGSSESLNVKPDPPLTKVATQQPLPNEPAVKKSAPPSADISQAKQEESVPRVSAKQKESEKDIKVSEETLLTHWKAYAEKCRAEKDFSAWTLLSQPIELLQGRMINITLSNPLQKHVLKRIKASLLTYLGQHLAMQDFTFHFVLEQKKESPATEVTGSEQLQHLASKYPYVATLQSKLALKPL